MKKGPELVRALWAVHLAVFLFAFAGLFPAWIALPVPLVVLGRTFFAALGLGLYFAWRGKNLPATSLIEKKLLFGGGFLLAVTWVTFFLSIRLSSVALGLLAHSTFPVFTVCLEPLLLGSPFSRRNLLLALLLPLGVYLLAPSLDWHDAAFRGILWGVFSGFTFALLTIINRRLAGGLGGGWIAAWQNAAAALLLLPFLFLLDYPAPGINDIILLVVLGLFCTALAHSLFNGGLRFISAQAGGIIALLEPLYAVVLAFLLLGQKPAGRTLLGGALILAIALAVTLRPESQEP